jgi:hypothetical protein
MAASFWVSIGPLATAGADEAGRLLERLEQELGIQAQPDPATPGRRIFILDARDAFDARDLAAETLGKVHPGWQGVVDLSI